MRLDCSWPQVKRFICIHGHFYQPPRENPWLETVETQDTAAPYHDWNERVCAECYAPNGAARIQNSKNQITRIVNNYARISFNFGPTLLSWLKENAPRTYRMILDGERRSRRHYNGHSSAMAQVYNHIIMPLANARDRMTQIRWGIADYEHHYGVAPEGMWLAETAADTESLELLAAARHPVHGAGAAPMQAYPAAEEDGQQDDWTDTPDATVDTTRPYLVRFASGASIAVFFYNGPSSRAIAFEGLLNSGENFAARLKSGFKEGAGAAAGPRGHRWRILRPPPQARRNGAGLRAAPAGTGQDSQADQLRQFLAQFPPEYECEIVDNTSWSCVHGVERWRSELRLQRRQAGLEPGLAHAAAAGAR